MPAAVLSGSLFPLANRLLVTDATRSARDVGRMTALNTLGGILGAMLAGFVVLPHLGLAAGVRLLALIGLTGWPWLIAALVARAADIWKVLPGVRRAEGLPGEIGITADDLVAGLYGLAVGWALTAIGL